MRDMDFINFDMSSIQSLKVSVNSSARGEMDGHNGPAIQAQHSVKAVSSGEAVAVSLSGSPPNIDDDHISGKDKTKLELLKKTFGIKDSAKLKMDEDSEGKDDSEPVEAEESPAAPEQTQPAQSQTTATATVEISESGSVSITWKVQQSDPLALDLSGEGIKTTGVENGVEFDINADGKMDKTSFVSGGAAFLALDKNGDGVINDGSELFGDQNGAANGFEELGKYDQNADGWIDANDAVYQDLRLVNAQGENPFDAAAAATLEQAGVAAIGLRYAQVSAYTNGGDAVSQTGVFRRADGSIAEAADVTLRNINIAA